MLAAVGKAEGEIAQAEQKFINSTKDTVLRPFYSFVDNDAKTIFKVIFLSITFYWETILMENIEMKTSSESEKQIQYTCSIRI